MNYVIHTDGSAWPNPDGPGGWCAIIDGPGGRSVLTGRAESTTNNRMELCSILEALRQLEDGAKCVVYSDSAYAVNGLREWSHKWETQGFEGIANPDLWRELVAERDRLNVTVEHVRGHNGDEGNELADRLAGEERAKAADCTNVQTGVVAPESLNRSNDYRLDGVKLRHGDALDVLRGFRDNEVDAVVTSPPYLDARPDVGIDFDHLAAILRECGRVCSGPLVVNVGRRWRAGRELLWWVDLIRALEPDLAHLDTRVWVKPNANPIRGRVLADSHEYVLILGDPGLEVDVDELRTPYAEESIARMSRKWHRGQGVKGDIRAEGDYQDGRELHPLGARPRSFVVVETGAEKGNPHPTPMPLELAAELVKFCPPGGTVLDPFAGSGTTLIAARQSGRPSVGIEIDAGHVQTALIRLGDPSAVNRQADESERDVQLALEEAP